MQKLIQPINKMKLTCSYKVPAYVPRFKIGEHYGIDCADISGADTKVYASGNGVVVATGLDFVVGKVIIIKYENAYNRKTKKAQDVIFRYYHLAKINVNVGQKVNKDTVIGNYGSTGLYGKFPHLHIEADTDTKYPQYSPTVRLSNLIKGTAQGANDKTMSSALDWLHTKASSPDFQSYISVRDDFTFSEDALLEVIR